MFQFLNFQNKNSRQFEKEEKVEDGRVEWVSSVVNAQPASTCSKSAIEAPEQCGKSGQS